MSLVVNSFSYNILKNQVSYLQQHLTYILLPRLPICIALSSGITYAKSKCPRYYISLHLYFLSAEVTYSQCSYVFFSHLKQSQTFLTGFCDETILHDTHEYSFVPNRASMRRRKFEKAVEWIISDLLHCVRAPFALGRQ